MKNLNSPLKDVHIYPSLMKKVHCSTGWRSNFIPQSNWLFYILEGSLVANIGEQSYFVRKNHLVLLPQNIPHSCWLLPGVNMTMYDVGLLSEVNGQDLFDFYGCTKDNHVISFPEKEMTDIYNAVTNLNTGNSFSYILMASELSKLCAMYIKARMDKENAKLEFADIISYMRTHIQEDMPLELLAKKTNYDPTYFSAKFKKETGMSPLKFFARMRAKEAARLIRTTELPLSEIAASVGFTNIYYFKRFFLQHMGVEPERYKNVFIAPSYLRETKG